MTRQEKDEIIDKLSEEINKNSHFYLADTSELNAAETSELRRKCFENNIKLIVVKNTLLKRALDKAEGSYDELYTVLKGSTSIMFTEQGNIPGRLIKEFRKTHKKPILKGAYVEQSVYIGDNQLESLANLKSKEELIGDIILMLQSPIKNVVSALQTGNNKLTGIIKTLSNK